MCHDLTLKLVWRALAEVKLERRRSWAHQEEEEGQGNIRGRALLRHSDAACCARDACWPMEAMVSVRSHALLDLDTGTHLS